MRETRFQHPQSFRTTSDGGALITGYAVGFQGGSYVDVGYLLRTDSMGRGGCNPDVITPIDSAYIHTLPNVSNVNPISTSLVSLPLTHFYPDHYGYLVDDPHCDSNCVTSLQAGFTVQNSGPSYSFQDASTGIMITGWQWDFGDGSFSTTPNPTHTYQASGTYSVCLEVFDSCGSSLHCQTLMISSLEESLQQEVRVFPNPTHDQFFLETGSYSGAFKLAICDLRGQILYQNTHQAHRNKKVEIPFRPARGIYLVRTFLEGEWVVRKLVVQ